MYLNKILVFFYNPKINDVFVFKSKSERLINFLIMIFIMFFFIILTSFISKLIINLIDLDFNNYVEINRKRTWDKFSKINNFFYIVLIGPLIEEIIHRKWLDFKKKSFYFSIIIITILGVKSYFFNSSYYYLYFIVSLLMFLVIFFTDDRKLKLYGKQYFKSFFYISCFLFSLIHISNYSSFLISNEYFFIPLLILPQFVMGLFFGFFRVKYGFLWGFFSHAIMNLPATLIYLISK
jgi:membrane protease YdiL (CAAX protease family)